MSRTYQLKRRAKSQQQTHKKITEAAVELHQSLGPANTTISAIAQRAGVQRLTVYRHFPDEKAILSACSGHYRQMNPLPDADGWARIADPEERLRRALCESYAYHRRTEPMMSKVLRDAQLHAPTMEASLPYLSHWERASYALVGGWGAEGQGLKRLLAALGHALDFWTWRSLVRERGLSEEEATEMMVGMVKSVVRG